MDNLPTLQGDSIYANTDGIQVYTQPDATADKQRNGDNGGVVSYSKGDLIGTYTGKIVNGFYEIDFIVRYKFGLFKWGVKNISFTGYLLPNQITTLSPDTVAKTDKAASDADFQKKLDAALGTDTTTGSTSTTASGSTTTAKSNTLLYLIGGLALLLGGGYLYMTRKKKSVVATSMPLNQPLKK